ncbi:MAG TPA: hypothetical protein V6D17_21680 [Candidatus Obscuribacterales bacterium]
MGDLAPDRTKDPLALDGMEDLLEQGGPRDGRSSAQDGIEEGTIEIEGGPLDGPSHLEVSAEAAAALLGISVRAVLKRLNKGTLRGRKVTTKFGEKWLVAREELPTEIHVEVAAQGGPRDGGGAEQAGTDAQPGSSQGGPLDGPERNDHIKQFVMGQGDLIATVLKQAQIIEQLTTDLRQKDEQIKLLTDSRHKRGRWAQFWSWFTGGR